MGLEGGEVGKMIRPALCLMSCKGCGGEVEKAIQPACAIELLHNFSLIHDDIEDGSPMRRDRPTVWKVYGEAQAINAGDALFALAKLALLDLSEVIPPDKVLEVERLFTSACLRLCEGQYLDLSFESLPILSEEDYLKMASGKTSTLFELPLRIGALIAEAPPETVYALAECGYYLGLGFQIQDDLFSIKEWASPDLERKKKIYPVVYAFTLRDIGERLKELYAKERLSPEDIGKVLRLLGEGRALEHSLKKAEEYYNLALKALERANLKDASEIRETIIALKERER